MRQQVVEMLRMKLVEELLEQMRVQVEIRALEVQEKIRLQMRHQVMEELQLQSKADNL